MEHMDWQFFLLGVYKINFVFNRSFWQLSTIIDQLCTSRKHHELPFNLDLWPITLTYNLANLTVQTGQHRQMDKQMYTTKRIISVIHGWFCQNQLCLSAQTCISFAKVNRLFLLLIHLIVCWWFAIQWSSHGDLQSSESFVETFFNTSNVNNNKKNMNQWKLRSPLPLRGK